MNPKDYSQMMAHLTRPAMARGGRIGFDNGGKTFVEQAKELGISKSAFRKPYAPEIEKRIVELANNDKLGAEAIANKLTEEFEGNFSTSPVGKRITALRKEGKIKNIPVKERAASIAMRGDIYGQAPGEKYLKIREIRDVDRKAIDRSTGKSLYNIPENAKFKINFGNTGALQPGVVSNIPKKFIGVQYFTTKKAAEKALAEREKLDISDLRYKPLDKAVKDIHKIALKYPDDISDINELSKMVYGNNKLENLTNISNDLVRYQQALLGFKNIKGFNVPKKEILDDILTSFPSENQYGKFAGSAVRRAKLDIRDKLLKTKGKKLATLRDNVVKLIDTNTLNLDEVMGLSATFEKAPGYTELGQVIDKTINKEKGKKIDKLFSSLFAKVMDGDPNPTITYKGKTIGVNDFNKISQNFASKYKIETPTIIYEPGKALNASNFIDSFDDLSPEAQKNIQTIAKKGVVLPSKAKPISKILEDNLLKLAGQIDKDCAQAVANGGRIGLQAIGSRNVCITKAKNYMSEQLERGIGTQQNAKTSLIKRILSSSANFIKQNLSPKELLKMENLIGKPALYGAALFETGLVADDVLRKGQPLNVSAAESLFGSVLNLDADAARAKNLLKSNVQLSPAAQEYAQNILDYDKYRKLDLPFPSSLIASKMPGSDRYFKMQEELRNKIANTPETGALDYQSALDEAEGTFKAKPKFLDAPDAPEVTPLINKLAKPSGRRIGPMTAKQDMQIDLSLPTYDRSFTASDDFLNQYLKSIGQEPLAPGEGTLFRMREPNQRGLFGTQEKFAGGGIAKLAGVNQGPPPESGPNSQGLPGLLKRVRNL